MLLGGELFQAANEFLPSRQGDFKDNAGFRFTAGDFRATSPRFTEENRKKLEGKVASIVTAAHPFGALSRAVRNKLNTNLLGEIIAVTLKILGQGMKVVCEVSLMAADAGMVRVDEDVIAVGGTGRGAVSLTECLFPPAATTDSISASYPIHMLPIDFSIVGTAHSHPSGSLDMSPTDMNNMYSRISIVIAHPYGPGDVAAYNKQAERVPIRVTG